MKRLLACLSLTLALILLAGCAEAPLASDMHWASVEGGQIEKSQAGEEFFFTVPIDPAGPQAEVVPVRIKLSGAVSNGSLRFELRDPGGQVVWNSGSFGEGNFSATTNYAPERVQTGMYRLGLVWEANTKVQYNLAWHALKLGPGALVTGAGMLLVGLSFLAYALKRSPAWRSSTWRYLGLGALFWVITVAAKFAFALPVNSLVYQALKVSYTDLFSPGNLVSYVYIGALTGIFEAGLAWAILNRVRWGRANWEQALAFGIGFGAVEALLLGSVSLFSAVAGLAAPDTLPVSALGNLARQSTFLMATAPIVERLFVILAHIFACVLIFYAIARGEKKWVWLAILYKTILDAPAGYAAFWGTSTPGKLWTIEALIALVGLVGLWGIVVIGRKYPSVNAAPVGRGFNILINPKSL